MGVVAQLAWPVVVHTSDSPIPPALPTRARPRQHACRQQHLVAHRRDEAPIRLRLCQRDVAVDGQRPASQEAFANTAGRELIDPLNRREGPPRRCRIRLRDGKMFVRSLFPKLTTLWR